MSEHERWAPGDHIHPKWHVIGLLGSGGMGAVYRVSDDRGKEFALKTYQTRAHDLSLHRDLEERFRKEARIWVGLTASENILTAFDVGDDGGVLYVVTEIAEGGSLEDWVNPGDLPDGDMVGRLMLQACLGMQHANDQGVVAHRDIKPANILLVPRQGMDPLVKVCDFGLASVATTSPSTVVRPVSWRSSDYVAPELLVDAGQANVRSDIYSIGVTFHEALTGEVPDPNAISCNEWSAAVPEKFREILARCLAIDPKRRYRSFRSLGRYLAKVLGIDLSSTDSTGILASGESMYRRGVQRAALGDEHAATLDLESTVYEFPTSPAAWTALGEVYEESGASEAALVCFQAALELDARSSKALLGVARASQTTEADAAAYFQEATKVAPNNPEAWYQRGMFEFETRSNDEALRSLERCLKLSPRHWKASSLLAKLFRSMGSTSGSLEALHEAIRIAPGNVGLRVSLAATQRSLGECKDALRTLFEAEKIELDSPEILREYSLVHYELGNISAALEYVDAAIAKNVLGAEQIRQHILRGERR